MDNNHGYENTETMQIDDTPIFPIERPNGYYEGGFSNYCFEIQSCLKD